MRSSRTSFLLAVVLLGLVATIGSVGIGCGSATPSAAVSTTATATVTPTPTVAATDSATPTLTPVHLTAKEEREYKLIAAFFAAGVKVEKTAMSATQALVDGDQEKAVALGAKAQNLFLDATTAADKTGFLSADVKVGGALETLEKRFMTYANALTVMMEAPRLEGFLELSGEVDSAKAPLQAELNRIAGH